MVCPNCSAAVADGSCECAACGLVFAKWAKRHVAPAEAVVSSAAPCAPAEAAFAPSDYAGPAAAGALFGVFWLGESLISAAYYCADAKMQVLILITGMSGSEGGGHDWRYMLGRLGLTDACVGLGRLLFFVGCLAMALPVCVCVRAAWRRAWTTGGTPP